MIQTSQIQVCQLTNPTPEEKATCLEIYTEAFKNDPLQVRLCGEDLTIHKLFHMAKLEPAFIDCQVWVARIDGQIGCVATIAQPGKDLWDTEEKKVYMQKALDSVNEDTRRWYSKAFGPLAAKKALAIPGGATATYYIQGIASLSTFQGQGLASAILADLTALATKEGKSLSLLTMSDKAVRLYRRNGFEITYEDTLPINEEIGDAPYYIMVGTSSG
ncbi:uncharacterized protein IL334_007250 [Kwoniella shivajii]|uniref:N-acetyltransferase domain-containing protein n=1 Tax=Kwoniella shivajii TaxID=564305 RepID=A0ABZ1D854_9TREE|nr:hypothetical protein IL334_007250 [Kwoniella shivajii]